MFMAIIQVLVFIFSVALQEKIKATVLHRFTSEISVLLIIYRDLRKFWDLKVTIVWCSAVYYCLLDLEEALEIIVVRIHKVLIN